MKHQTLANTGRILCGMGVLGSSRNSTGLYGQRDDLRVEYGKGYVYECRIFLEQGCERSATYSHTRTNSLNYIMQHTYNVSRSTLPAGLRERKFFRNLARLYVMQRLDRRERALSWPMGASAILMIVIMGWLSTNSFAQDAAVSSVRNLALPNAPGRGDLYQSGIASTTTQSSASLSGTVLDISGAAVSGAEVTLAGQSGLVERTLKSDNNGQFSFGDLASGTYRVTITSSGLQSFVSADIHLMAGEAHELLKIGLPIASTTSDVQVTVTQEEVAQEQVRAAEKQRVLGIIPNFYSSYIWHAAPLTSKLKFGLALRTTTDPVAFLIAGGVAGVEQAHNTFPGYGSGPQGYAKRYGAAYADNVIGRMVGSAILPSLLHQDPRYFYKGTGSTSSRALYAVGATIICRGDNGRWQPNYSHVLGNFAAAAISNLYRSPEDRKASLTIRNGLIITGSNAAGNLVREFVLRRFTSKIPDYEKGKP